MRALAIVHQADAGPGVFADAGAERGWELATWSIASDEQPPGDPLGFDAVMSFGGAAHPDQENRYGWLALEKALLARVLAAHVPLLGVCLGAQLVAEAGGGATRRAGRPEVGWQEVQISAAGAADPVLGPLAPRARTFQWHSYECVLPRGAVALAHSQVCTQAYRLGGCAWGIQFHAEVTPADAWNWVETYGSDPDAISAEVEPDTLRAQTQRSIGHWNEVGKALCGRFLEVAEGRR
jgi:GMP synthase (glutamine-hydrolysing)